MLRALVEATHPALLRGTRIAMVTAAQLLGVFDANPARHHRPSHLRALRHAAALTLQRAATGMDHSLEKLLYLERSHHQNRTSMTDYRGYLTRQTTLKTAA